MIHLELQPEIEAQLTAEAHARGLSLQKHIEQIVTGEYAEHEATEALAGINRGLADVAAGRIRPAEEVFAELLPYQPRSTSNSNPKSKPNSPPHTKVIPAR